MIVAGWRRMTVSLNGAHWLAFCSSVEGLPGDVQGQSDISCFRNVSRPPHMSG
jgi:hypothetical protein